MSGGAFQFKSESPKRVAREPQGAAAPSAASEAQAPAPPSKSDAIARLAAIAAGKPQPPPVHHAPKDPKEPGKFEPGKKPVPRSGHTVHDVFSDPDKLADLHSKVSEWEKANPKRKLMGPHVKAMYPHMSDGQARNVAQRVHKAHQEFLASKMRGYMGRGAKKALDTK